MGFESMAFTDRRDVGKHSEVDDVVCLEAHQFFGSIGAYHADFRQAIDEEVTITLASLGTEGRRSDDGPIDRTATR